MNKIIISNATLADIQTMVKWGEQSPELWGDSSGGWYTETGLGKLVTDKDRSICLVSKISDRITGMCITHNFGEWAYCEALYVDKDFRKLGIAQLLIDKTIQILKEKGCTMIGTFVEVDNPVSIKFHEKIGYKKGFQFHYMSKLIDK